ncbi:MAG TPA: hypothetical protein VK116_06960, partial [Planctomycetota bacterium]|nr:hypothetical protein [Planctomycetota bacterium]
MFFGLCVFNLSESASLLAARIEWSFVGRVESFSEVEGFDGPQFFGVELGDPVSGRFVWYEEWAGRVDGNPSFAEVYAGDQSFTV